MIRLETNVPDVIARLRKYRNSLHERMNEIISQLVVEGEIVARAEIVEMDAVFTGELANSITSFYDEQSRIGFVRCDADYGMFVEFGTGIVGSQAPYSGTAMAEIGYQYGGGTTYVQTEDGRVGWYFPARDGKWYFTEGQPSHPFMWETAQILKRQVIPIARRVFGTV